MTQKTVLGTIKQRVFEIIEKPIPGDIASKGFDIVIITLILLNIAAVILSSFQGLSATTLLVLDAFEVVSVIVFSA